MKRFLLGTPLVEFCAEGIGAFHIIVEVIAPSLDEYTDWMRSLDRLSERLLTRKEEMYVCSHPHRDRDDRVVWVLDGVHKRALPCGSLEKVIAERDYMHVYSGGRNWVVHATMRFFRELLCDDGFVQLNRSALIRSDTIQTVGRVEKRWVAKLHDGTEQFISKAHVASALQQLGLRSSRKVDCSSSNRASVDRT
jgi:DNA-binding LytR/AlgR family response regulator